MTGAGIREVLLEVVHEMTARDQMQQVSILREASERLGLRRNLQHEQALLTAWYDLFRNGHLSWGLDLENPNPPFCHLTQQGRRTLEHLSRDPANRDGYMKHLASVAPLNDVAASYITEALVTYNSNAFKATAVMVGAAAKET